MPFPELSEAPGTAQAEMRLIIREGAVDSLAPGIVLAEGCSLPLCEDEYFHHWLSAERQVWLSFAAQPAGYLLRFKDVCCFCVSSDALTIRCFPAAGVTDNTIRHLFLDQVLPLAIAQRGSLVLHASAFSEGGAATVLLGATGSGKSTLAAYCAREGAQFMSDDFVVVEPCSGGFLALGSYGSMRLWRDSKDALFANDAPPDAPIAEYTDKRRYRVPGNQAPAEEQRARLERAVLLEAVGGEEETQLHRLSPQSAFFQVLSGAFILDVLDPAVSAGHFSRISGFVQAVPVYRLSFSLDYKRLAEASRLLRG